MDVEETFWVQVEQEVERPSAAASTPVNWMT